MQVFLIPYKSGFLFAHSISGERSNRDQMWCVNIGEYMLLAPSWVLITMAVIGVRCRRTVRWAYHT